MRSRAVAIECAKAEQVSQAVRVTFDKAEYEAGRYAPELIMSSDRQKPHDFHRITLGTSECLHHARCALDHLVFNLARLDSGSVQDDTAFPVVQKVEGWNKAARQRLQGIVPKHRDMIREYQPFNGNDWLSLLAKLNNDDKHRAIVPVINDYQGPLDLSRPVVPCADDPTRVELFDVNLMGSISFAEPEVEVASTLNDLVSWVSQVVADFVPVFKQEGEISVTYTRPRRTPGGGAGWGMTQSNTSPVAPSSAT